MANSSNCSCALCLETDAEGQPNRIHQNVFEESPPIHVALKVGDQIRVNGRVFVLSSFDETLNYEPSVSFRTPKEIEEAKRG